MRDWARREERVREIIDAVDNERLGILRDLYLRAGLDADEAEVYTTMHMAYVMGSRMMLFDGSPALVEQRRLLGERFLIPKTGS